MSDSAISKETGRSASLETREEDGKRTKLTLRAIRMTSQRQGLRAPMYIEIIPHLELTLRHFEIDSRSRHASPAR